MIFESIEHAQHYASGLNIQILLYDKMVIDVTDFKDKHPGNIIKNILNEKVARIL
jgi:hypothetical protein